MGEGHRCEEWFGLEHKPSIWHGSVRGIWDYFDVGSWREGEIPDFQLGFWDECSGVRN